MQTETYSWRKLASVQVGGAICLPVILIGYELASLYGRTGALWGIAIGNLVLAGLALICSEMTWKNKRSTPENAALYLGSAGKKLIALLLTLSMCGWFAIQTQVVAAHIGIETKWLAILFASSLLFGLKGITKLADASIPIMCLTLALALIFAYQGNSFLESPCTSDVGFDVQAISLVMAVAIGVCIDMPTFFQHAKSKKDSHRAALATFLVGLPLVELAGVSLCEWSRAATLMQALQGSHVPFWDWWVSLFLLFAAWTTNTTNLYSAAMGIASLFPAWKMQRAFLVTACLAALLSQVDLISRLSQVLEWMGVLLASGFGVILMAFVMQKSAQVAAPVWMKLAAFVVGAFVGLQWSVPTGIALVDSMLAASSVTFLGRFCVCQNG